MAVDISTLTPLPDGTFVDDAGNLYDNFGNPTGSNFTDASMASTSVNPSLGNNNQPSNVPSIVGTVANFGTNLTALLLGRSVQTPTARVVSPQQVGLQSQMSAGTLLLLVLGAIILFRAMK